MLVVAKYFPKQPTKIPKMLFVSKKILKQPTKTADLLLVSQKNPKQLTLQPQHNNALNNTQRKRNTLTSLNIKFNPHYTPSNSHAPKPSNITQYINQTNYKRSYPRKNWEDTPTKISHTSPQHPHHTKTLICNPNLSHPQKRIWLRELLYLSELPILLYNYIYSPNQHGCEARGQPT